MAKKPCIITHRDAIGGMKIKNLYRMGIESIAERLEILSAASLPFEERLERIELLNELAIQLRVLQGLQKLDSST